MYIYLSKFFVDYYEIKICQKYKREKDIYDRDIVYKASIIILGAKICFCFEIFSYLR